MAIQKILDTFRFKNEPDAEYKLAAVSAEQANTAEYAVSADYADIAVQANYATSADNANYAEYTDCYNGSGYIEIDEDYNVKLSGYDPNDFVLNVSGTPEISVTELSKEYKVHERLNCSIAAKAANEEGSETNVDVLHYSIDMEDGEFEIPRYYTETPITDYIINFTLSDDSESNWLGIIVDENSKNYGAYDIGFTIDTYNLSYRYPIRAIDLNDKNIGDIVDEYYINNIKHTISVENKIDQTLVLHGTTESATCLSILTWNDLTIESGDTEILNDTVIAPILTYYTFGTSDSGVDLSSTYFNMTIDCGKDYSTVNSIKMYTFTEDETELNCDITMSITDPTGDSESLQERLHMLNLAGMQIGDIISDNTFKITLELTNISGSKVTFKVKSTDIEADDYEILTFYGILIDNIPYYNAEFSKLYISSNVTNLTVTDEVREQFKETYDIVLGEHAVGFSATNEILNDGILVNVLSQDPTIDFTKMDSLNLELADVTEMYYYVLPKKLDLVSIDLLNTTSTSITGIGYDYPCIPATVTVTEITNNKIVLLYKIDLLNYLKSLFPFATDEEIDEYYNNNKSNDLGFVINQVNTSISVEAEYVGKNLQLELTDIKEDMITAKKPLKSEKTTTKNYTLITDVTAFDINKEQCSINYGKPRTLDNELNYSYYINEDCPFIKLRKSSIVYGITDMPLMCAYVPCVSYIQYTGDFKNKDSIIYRLYIRPESTLVITDINLVEKNVGDVLFDDGYDCEKITLYSKSDVFITIKLEYKKPSSGANDNAVFTRIPYLIIPEEDTTSIEVSIDAPESVIDGTGAFVEGYKNYALDNYAHAEGAGTFAFTEAAHSEGISTMAGICGNSDYVAEKNCAQHAEGIETSAFGIASHSEGAATKAVGECSHAEGDLTIAGSAHSHAEGFYTSTYGIAAHSEGYHTTAYGLGAHAEGCRTRAVGSGSYAGGYAEYPINSIAGHPDKIFADGIGSFVHGYSNKDGNISAVGSGSHAEGVTLSGGKIVSYGDGSYAAGYANNSMGISAYGNGSYAAGYADNIDGSTIASGIAAYSFGAGASALGDYSHVEGEGTIASGGWNHVQGTYNTFENSKNAFVIGNGDDENSRSDAFIVDWNGNVSAAGNISAAGNLVVAGEIISPSLNNNYVENFGYIGSIVNLDASEETEKTKTTIFKIENNAFNLELGIAYIESEDESPNKGYTIYAKSTSNNLNMWSSIIQSTNSVKYLDGLPITDTDTELFNLNEVFNGNMSQWIFNDSSTTSEFTREMMGKFIPTVGKINSEINWRFNNNLTTEYSLKIILDYSCGLNKDGDSPVLGYEYKLSSKEHQAPEPR